MHAPALPEAQEPAPAPDTPREPSAPRDSRRLLILQRGPLTKDAHDRLALLVVRAVFVLAAAGLGLAGGRILADLAGNPEGYDPVLVVLASLGAAGLVIGVELLFSQSPIRTLSAITFGLLIGLALSLVFQYVVEFIASSLTDWSLRFNRPEEFRTLLAFLKILSTTIFCYFGISTLLRTKDDFKFIIPFVEFRRDLRGQAPLVLDTSVFVDGRIRGILATGLLDQRLIVPRFVVAELQTIADSADRSLRERGRRGLDILHEVEKASHVEILDTGLSAGSPVDSALIAVAAQLGGKIVTTDFNLQKSARVQNVPVLNVNDLATALKPVFVPGEVMTVRLLKEGEDRGQAVGYLRDGTMVVVENARQKIGEEVLVEVTSALQTNAGKMIFGRLRRAGKGAGET